MTIELNKDGLEAAKKEYLTDNNDCREKQRDKVRKIIEAYLPYHDKQQVERIAKLEKKLNFYESTEAAVSAEGERLKKLIKEGAYQRFNSRYEVEKWLAENLSEGL